MGRNPDGVDAIQIRERRAALVTQLRIERGFSQASLAHMVGLESHSQIARLEAGTTHGSWDVLIGLAEALGVPLEVMLLGDRSGQRDGAIGVPLDATSDSRGRVTGRTLGSPATEGEAAAPTVPVTGAGARWFALRAEGFRSPLRVRGFEVCNGDVIVFRPAAGLNLDGVLAVTQRQGSYELRIVTRMQGATLLHPVGAEAGPATVLDEHTEIMAVGVEMRRQI